MIGYRNRDNPVETDELLPEEIEIQKRIEAATFEVHELRNKLHTLELRRGLMQVKCPHTVFIDKYNDPHDHRVCVICGKSIGVI
ncbi:hypothetical protein [Acinetobacter sp.]|uniref:hypothetical protein n=1 Tax=Acinetobacter sp. TaxID=472 RepID=UPI00388DBC8A